LVCGRFGFLMWPFWFVAVLVCGRFGFLMWPFWFVAVLDGIRSNGRRTVIQAGNASPGARARRRHIAPNCRPTVAMIPGGAIDVAARLTWTCPDTRHVGRPHTCDDDPWVRTLNGSADGFN